MSLRLGAVAGFMLAVMGLVAGLIVVVNIYGEAQTAFAHRESTRASCIAGNDRACRLYEVEWKR